MKKFMITIAVIALTFVLGTGTPVAKTWECKIGLIHPPDLYTDSGYPTAFHFKNLVEANSGGRIKVEIYPSGQLGSETEMMEGLQIGTVQIACPSIGVTTRFIPDFFALNIPFMFYTHREAWEFYDSDFVKETMNETALKRGLRYIGQTEDGGGFVALTNNVHPIKTPEDLRKVRMRDLEHPGRLAFWRALGVSATPIPWEELYLSLQTGVVDGQQNAPGLISWAKLWEVQKYATAMGHYYGSLQWFISERWFQSLPDDLKKVVLDAMDEAKWVGRGVSVVKNITGWEEMEKAGMEIYWPTAEEKEAFRVLGQTGYMDWVRKHLKNDLVDRAMEKVVEIREKNMP